VSKAAGLYDKHGLDVELTFVRPAVLTTALNAGKDFDVGYASAANIPTVNVKGGDLVMIGGSAQGGIFSIVANPAIRSIADLKGKKAGVTSTGSTTDLLLRQVLQANKLVPGQDVGIVVIADDSAIVAALTSHQLDAIINSEPFTSIAVAQGGSVIYDQAKSGERAVQTPVTVKRSYLPAHRDVLKRLLMANMEAIHMIKTNPAQAAKYAAPYLKMDDLNVLQTALEKTAQIMDPDMNVPLENLATSLKIAAANVPEVGKLKPEDLVDLSPPPEPSLSGPRDPVLVDPGEHVGRPLDLARAEPPCLLQARHDGSRQLIGARVDDCQCFAGSYAGAHRRLDNDAGGVVDGVFLLLAADAQLEPRQTHLQGVDRLHVAVT